MDRAKKRRLEAAGWRVGSAADFLGLAPEEEALVELKIRLTDGLRKRRKAMRISQAALAKRLKSSQSRVAKIEAVDSTVSLDLLIRAHFALGASVQDLGKMLQARRRRAA